MQYLSLLAFFLLIINIKSFNPNLELSKENDYKNIIKKGYQTILLNIITTLNNITSDKEFLNDISKQKLNKKEIQDILIIKQKITNLKNRLKHKRVLLDVTRDDDDQNDKNTVINKNNVDNYNFMVYVFYAAVGVAFFLTA